MLRTPRGSKAAERFAELAAYYNKGKRMTNWNNIHANYFSDWQTDPRWLDWAGLCFANAAKREGEPYTGYLDPCPAGWNPDEYDSGLDVEWTGDVYVNPPGSNSTKGVKLWWNHLCSSDVRRVIWCFFNIESLFIVDPSPLEIPGILVAPRERVPFVKDGKLQGSPRNRTVFWLGGFELEDVAPTPDLRKTKKTPHKPPIILRTGVDR